jgi:hypothetical protein
MAANQPHYTEARMVRPLLAHDHTAASAAVAGTRLAELNNVGRNYA